MRQKQLLILLVALLIFVVLLIGLVLQFAPQLSPVETSSNADSARTRLCLQDEQGRCLRLPTVTGLDLDNQGRTFPDDFQGDYNLVVMPFDREQQVLAITWLPIFQDLRAEYPSLAYYSIAALPDLAPAIRLLVMGGMSAGVRDETTRAASIVVFLEEQERFLQSLTIPNPDVIQVFVFGRDGTVYWRGSGDYHQETGADLQAYLATLP